MALKPTDRMIEILAWAESMMNMEREIMKLINTNPAVADAYSTYKQAEEQLKIVATLVK
jgi:hypothetical protein